MLLRHALRCVHISSSLPLSPSTFSSPSPRSSFPLSLCVYAVNHLSSFLSGSTSPSLSWEHDQSWHLHSRRVWQHCSWWPSLRTHDSKYSFCSLATRALLLSTYIKLVNLYPEIKPQIQGVLQQDSQSRNFDLELQQRAIEYLKLSHIANVDLMVMRK